MTRMDKQDKKRNLSPKKRKIPTFKKTGPKKETSKYKEKINAIENVYAFIPKIKGK